MGHFKSGFKTTVFRDLPTCRHHTEPFPAKISTLLLSHLDHFLSHFCHVFAMISVPFHKATGPVNGSEECLLFFCLVV